jgi:hypothetical protein
VDQIKHTLNLISGSFAIGGIAAVGVLSALDFDDAGNPDLAGGATLAATAFGVVGLLVALLWWSRAGESPRTETNLMLSFVVRVAVAEVGLLMGILGLVMTGSATASYIGLGFFLVALLMLSLGLRRIE